MSAQLRVATLLIAAASTTCIVAGCSKSSSPSSVGAADATTAATGAAAAAASAIANAVGGGSLDMSKQCAAMKSADVQALMKAPVTPVVVNPGECSFYGGDLKIDLYPNDPTQKYQNPVGGPNTTALSGIGDQAQWFQPVSGASTPWVEAHKGSLTCVLSPADASETTMTYTGSEPFYTITPTAAAAYAQEEGKLCTDAFGAS
jgi:hypothetical protein